MLPDHRVQEVVTLPVHVVGYRYLTIVCRIAVCCLTIAYERVPVTLHDHRVLGVVKIPVPGHTVPDRYAASPYGRYGGGNVT